MLLPSLHDKGAEGGAQRRCEMCCVYGRWLPQSGGGGAIVQIGSRGGGGLGFFKHFISFLKGWGEGVGGSGCPHHDLCNADHAQKTLLFQCISRESPGEPPTATSQITK